LALDPDFGQNQMPRVTAPLFVIQLHNQRNSKSGIRVRQRRGRKLI
jgi:hypothetical protein